MSSQASSNESSALTVYQHLLRLHQSEDLIAKHESLNALPASYRQQIFSSISAQSGQALEADYGKVHVFNSLPKLQQAVAKVAVYAFQTLDQAEKDEIVSKISEHPGRNEMENLAADNIPVLLETMHDSLGDLSPELQKILDEWVDQATEGEQRNEARSKVIDFLKDPRQTKIDLDSLKLKSLPEIFNAQPFISRLEILWLGDNCLTSLPEQICQLHNLQDLRLYWNQLTSLPEEFSQLQNLEFLELLDNRLASFPEQICQLRNLKKLYLDGNSFPSLPAQIGQLQNLDCLSIARNRLASLPEQICQLHNLKKLFLSENPLTSLPPQIGQLKNLEYFDVDENQLATLPEEISQLQNLIRLSLRATHLTSLPEQISLLQNLSSLLINENPSLQGLPNQLLDLHQGCRVDISRTGLSENVRSNLEQACNAEGYQGPRIIFSMEDMEQYHDGKLKKLPTLIEELFCILGEEPKEFPKLSSLDKQQTRSIRSWISRLSDTADYKRKGEFQKAFVKQILGYLQEANDDPQFRQVFLNILADATETCGDRISLSILHVGIASRLRLITDIQELRKFLIGTVWPVYMLEEIARKKTETLRFFDEIEVYLGYPIMLREKLGLEIAVQDMLYFRCSALNQSDLEQAAQFVRQQQNDEHAVCAYLASREDWINALKAQYPDRSAAIEEENYQELEGAGENQEKLDQLETNQKQRWEALTAWALVDLNP
ncbi:MAG: leucine-rich repeat domain-containing protein [Parachlamydiales bacterium]|nr:leucine-rich repeat domain-containing protein [Candidatus Acheromyda pituitae]